MSRLRFLLIAATLLVICLPLLAVSVIQIFIKFNDDFEPFMFVVMNKMVEWI